MSETQNERMIATRSGTRIIGFMRRLYSGEV
jgi:hypothetical protein